MHHYKNMNVVSHNHPPVTAHRNVSDVCKMCLLRGIYMYLYKVPLMIIIEMSL